MPASPWLGDTPPAKPTVTWAGRELKIAPAGEPVGLFVVRVRTGDRWQTIFRPADGDKTVVVTVAGDEVRVSAVDRANNEGAATAAVRK